MDVLKALVVAKIKVKRPTDASFLQLRLDQTGRRLILRKTSSPPPPPHITSGQGASPSTPQRSRKQTTKSEKAIFLYSMTHLLLGTAALSLLTRETEMGPDRLCSTDGADRYLAYAFFFLKPKYR